MSEPQNAYVPVAEPAFRNWLIALVCVLVLLAAGLYYGHTVLHLQARTSAEEQLQAVASLKSRAIQRWLNDRLIFLREPPAGVVAVNFARLLAGREAATAARILNARFDYMHAAIPELTSIWLYDLDGQPVLGSHVAHSMNDARHRDALRAVIENGRPGLIDFHGGDETVDSVELGILVPLVAGSEPGAAIVGFALFHIDPRRELFPLIRQWPVASISGETELARREGGDVVFLNPLRHIDAPPLSLRRPLATPGFIAGRAFGGAGEVLAGVDYRGVPALGVAQRIPDTEWLLVARMDDSEIYRDARRNFLWLVAASLVLLAALLAMGRIFFSALRARAREARYRMLAESGSDMVWLYDLAAQRFTYVSPAVEQLRGYTVDEALRQSMEDVLTPESYQRVEAELPAWIEAFAAGDESARTRSYEICQYCKDGSTIETEAVVTLIADAQGRAAQIQGVSRDITERKLAADELRKLSLALEQSPVSIIITNLDAEIEYVNDSFVRVTGFRREEALGRNPRILKSGRTPQATYEEMWARLPRGLPWRGELINRRKDGGDYVQQVSITPIHQPDGRIAHYLAVQEDITERRRIEEALAESEEKFRTIYDSINDAIYVHDATSGRILDVNLAACRMYGAGREQLLGLDTDAISASTPPYTPEAAREHTRLAKETGWREFEWLARDIHGRQFWVVVHLQLLSIGGGQRVLAVVHDIDKRKHAEEDLKRALGEARALNRKLAEAQSQLLQSEKMASIGQLAAGVAHELNNPIGFVSSNLGTLEGYLHDIFGIIAAYELAEARLGDQSPLLDAARDLKRERDFDFLKGDIFQLMTESKDGLVRVAKIVKDLKDFSRAGEATYQWADLHQGLDSTLNIVWNELKYKCTVKKDYGEQPPVWCVPSQLNQVFMNLLMNAGHAIPEKGEITIRTGRRDDTVFVAVSDTGTGIAAENLNRIFEPFYTTKPIGKGTGLGLSLAYSIVQKHQGRIEVQSEPGKGTTFTVWIPVEAKEAETAVPPAPTS